MLGGRWAWVSPAPRGGRAPCTHVWERQGKEGAVGHVGPPGQALQALSESHNGPTARGFPGSPAGPPAEAPRRAAIPYLSGTRSSWPVAAASPPSAGHELFFHFSTGTNRSDKTLSDEGRTGIDKSLENSFSANNRRSQHTESGQEGGWGSGGGLNVPPPICWDAGPCPALGAGSAPRGCRARGTDGLASSPHMAEPSR